MEDDHRKRAGIEFAGDIDGVRGLVTKEQDHDTFAEMISHHSGVLEGVPPNQVHNNTVVRKSVDSDESSEMGNKGILEAIKATPIIRDNLKEVEQLLGNTSNNEYFPVDTICPYLGLRKESYIRLKKSLPKNPYCDRRQPAVVH